MNLNLSKQAKIALSIILINAIILCVVAIFRFAIYDEKLYLHETVMMSEVLKQGEWVGNYGVGVHGFLFKLPVALIFTLTGPSIYIATLFHIVLASVTTGVFYLIAAKFVKIQHWVLVALVLLITNYSFLSWSITFHREIPLLFSLVVFTYFFIKSNNKYLLNGLLLLLVLDAKEYVFFTILPALFLYLFIKNYKEVKNIWIAGLRTAKAGVLLVLPSFIYLFLMFYTSAIPINMFNASLFGLTESRTYQLAHTLPEKALSDLSTYTNNNYSYKTSQFLRDDGIVGKALAYPVLLLGYVEKLFYIANFSFQGVPLVMLIPSLASSIYIFKKWYSKNSNLLFLNLFYWSYFLIYIIRSSHQRYILPLIPFVILFFILFLRQSLKGEKKFSKYFIYTLVVLSIVVVGTLFYQSITEPKELFNIVSGLGILALLCGLFYFKKYREIVVKFILVAIIGASLFINVYALITKNQIHKSLTWGINGEAEKIAQLIEPEDTIFIDCKSGTISEFTYLINVYRRNNYLPMEWHWRLNKNKVSRELDIVDVTSNFYYGMDMSNMEEFRESIKEKEIGKIVLLKSKLDNNEFPLEQYIEVLNNENWVELDSVTQLKNKEVYIFEVSL